jgi:hypothetical protein
MYARRRKTEIKAKRNIKISCEDKYEMGELF